MRCYGDVALFHRKAAVFLRSLDVLLNLSGVGRADIHDRPKGTKRPFLFFYSGHGFVCGWVVITLAVEFIKVMNLGGFKTYSKWNADEFTAYIKKHGFEVLKNSVMGSNLAPLCCLIAKR